MIQIKIKLDVPESTITYYRLQEQWENEGGAIAIFSKEDLIKEDIIPFLPGEKIRVINGTIDLMENDFYYIADIEKISEKTTKNQRLVK